MPSEHHPQRHIARNSPMNRRAILAGVGALACMGAAVPDARAGAPNVPLEAPTGFLLRQFADADVVLLAEDHGVRQNLAFLHSLIPDLYGAGVRSIAMEFGDVEQQAELDQLVTARRYDEAVARNLMFQYDPGWPLRDYWDVYRAAWAFNRTLPRGAAPFRIINLTYRLAWEEMAGPMMPATAARVFHKGPVDPYRARVVQREILDRGEKTLAFVGWPHAITRFALPLFDFNAPGFVRRETRNLGHVLHAEHPGRVRSVILHAPFLSKDGLRLVQPAEGALERAFMAHGAPCAFDLRGPAGSLRDSSSHAVGDPAFTIGDFADGYIILDRLSRLEGCALDPDYVTPATFEDARRRFPRELRRQPQTLEEYWESSRAFVDIRARYAMVADT